MTPSETMKLRILEAASAEPAAPPPAGRLRAAAPAGLAAAAMAAVLLLWGDLDHAAARPLASGAWIIAGTVALAIAATGLALPSRRSMLSPARWRLLAVAIGVPVLLVAWMALWHTTYADPFVRVGGRCLLLTGLTAPWPFLALLRVSRRLDPRNARFGGAALGAAAGAWAAVMVELWCPLATPGHVLVGHALPIALLGAAGAAIGVRLFGIRPVRSLR